MLKCTVESASLKVDCNGHNEECRRLCCNKSGNLYKYKTLSSKGDLLKVKNNLRNTMGNNCFVCGESMNSIRDVELQIEHIYPKSSKFLCDEENKYLESCMKNFKLICGKCNVTKSDIAISYETYKVIYNYDVSNDEVSYISNAGINFAEEYTPISLYYCLKDEHNFAMEIEFLNNLNSVGREKYLKKEKNIYIQNTLKRERK